MGEIPSNEEEAEYDVLLEISDQPYDTGGLAIAPIMF